MSLLAQTSTQQLVTSSITAVTAQFQTLSTLTFNVSSINGIVPGAAFSGSTVALSTGLITTSTLLTNALTTSSITSYGTVDIQGNVLSNVGTEYFIKPLYTTTFLPTNISGLKAWFDASKPASITSNGSGQVFTWSNLAGFANATQAVASNTPVTGQLSINSLNTVQFNPTNEITFGPISYTTATRAVFAVLVTPFNPSVTNKGTYIFGGQDATLGTAGFHGYQFAASGFEFQTSIGGGSGVGYVTYTALSNAGAFSATNAWLLSYHPGNGIFVNGTSNSTAGNLNTGSSTDLFGSIGQGFNVNTFYVAEFLQYDTTFSLAQRQTVEGYLAWKWGIQSRLNGTHPYLSIAPPPLGITFLAMGGITADTGSNISFSATNKIRLTAPVEIPTTLNTSSITVSTINDSTLTQLITQPLQSTFSGLGSAGYISSSQLYSTVTGIGSGFTGSTVGLSAATINTSTINSVYLSSVQGYVSSFRTDSLTVGGPTGYVSIKDLTAATTSTGQLVAGAGFISSLQINTLSFGPSGYVIVGDVIANSLSTKKLNTQALYTNNAYIGNVSSQSAILFPGIDGTYRGTAVAEQTTGVGTQELLLYKVSSTTDQIRLQTTGNIVFEAGAAARSWNSTTQLATPTLYIAGSTSNVGVGTAAPAATLDVAGTGRFQTLSSFALNVSSINGAAPGGTFNGSTLALSTGSITASNVVVRNNGNVGSNTYGIGIDTLTVQTTTGALAGGIASLYFGASNPTYPLARIGAVDYGVTYGNSALVFQTATPANASLSGVIAYQYTGSNQSFTVPSGITAVTVYMWGAGGGGGNGTGGAGAFIQGTLAVTPGNTLNVIVGGGGVQNGTTTTFGGGGASGTNNSASGGGRSAIQLSGTELVDVGGGGGSSYSGYQGGAANYSPTINGGAGYRGGQTTYGGYGGTQTAGGVAVAGAPISSGTSGSYLQGGAGGNYAGGGGGGYYGGGGGGTANNDGCAGGGGSSYTTNAAFTLITGSNSPNTAAQAPATASPYYSSGVAAGAVGGNTGGSGLVVIVYNPPYNLSETMRISQTGNIGIGTSTPQALLHVSGMTYSIATSTQALTVSSIAATTISTPSLQVSTINGAAPWQQSFLNSTVQGLGTAGYISTAQLNSTVSGLTIVATNAFTGSTTTLSAGTINVSTLNTRYLSSVQGYVSSLRTDSLTVGGPTGYVTVQDLTTGTVSTGQLVAGAGFISSLQINTLSFGPSGYVIVGDVIANSLSTKKLNTQALYTNNLYVGNVSSQSAILFPGIDGTYKGTAIAEQTTGVGTQELLLYKVSSTTDQIRLQTTGNIVFEAGAASRSWNSTTQLATPTLYIAGSTSNVGVGTAAPAATLDVVGTGRFQLISSYALNVSSINGAAPGGTFNGSTNYLSANTVQTATLVVKNATVNLAGQLTSNVYGTGSDTLTLQTTVGGTSGGTASLYFGTPTYGYPLARIAALDEGGSYADSSLIFQTATHAANSTASGANTFQYTGSSQNYTVPAGVTSITVKMWGAGGANQGGSGGAGAYLTGTLAVTPGQVLSLIVGQAGRNDGISSGTYGGGGSATSGYGSGGGRSAIQTTLSVTVTGVVGNGTTATMTTSGAHGLITGEPVILSGLTGYSGTYAVASAPTPTTFTVASSTSSTLTGQSGQIIAELVDVGGGGGGGSFSGGGNGNATYTGSAVASSGANGGGGGTQTAGGAAGGGSGTTAGSLLQGGASAGISYARGGGGGGYYGGGGGYADGTGAGGGGGGSSWSGLLTSVSGANSTDGHTPPGTTVPGYISGVATGGAAPSPGPGLVIIVVPLAYNLAETMRISKDAYVGIGTATPQSLLHVSGMTYSIAVSTQNITVSSINGQTFGGPITSTMVGLGTVGYISTSQLTSTVQALTSNISSMIDPTELTSSIVGLGTAGFISTVGLSFAVASTAQGLGTFGYTSTNQLLSTTLGIYGAIGSNIATTVQPQFTSTVAGLGTAGYISTSTAFNGSTLALSTGSVYASNVVVRNNGNVGSNTYGIGIDTLIVQTTTGALAGGIASLYFGASNATYPLARIGAVDYGITYGNSALVFQTATPANVSLSGVIAYQYTGSNQSFTVPSGITAVTVYMWGAGGGGGAGTGGAGAFIQGTLAVTPGNTLNVIVGQGGVQNGTTTTFGGGGSSGQANSASGGGRSAIQLSGTELVDVGGGGGGSYSGFQGGAANFSPTINGGAGYRGGQATYGGFGGTQTAGGAVVTGPVATGTAGSFLQGGTGGAYGGGGGGGFYGGGGGSTAGGDGCAGGGGSSYTTNAAFTLITGSNSPNTGAQAPATASPYYSSGVAAGATGGNTGGSGLVVIVYNPPYNLSETMRISHTGNIGIGTSTPQALLHVSGITYSIATSTQALTVSSINGQTFGGPIQSTVIGLGTTGYISTTQLTSTVTNLITRIGAGGGGGGGGGGDTTFVGSTTFLSATQVLFSTQTGYNISSVLGFVSSLQVDELQIGTGFGIIAFGDTNMSSISTLGIAAGLGNFQTINVSSINGAIPGTGSGGATFTGNLGTVSSLTALRFFGLTGTYANTAVAEVSTGTGLQELLLYKVSSISDQVRVQTTGNVIFESGVGARSWPTAPRVLPPTLYIAGSNSNVGIGTSNPLTTLDVVGTGRFQTLSSLNITAGSINYSVAFV